MTVLRCAPLTTCTPFVPLPLFPSQRASDKMDSPTCAFFTTLSLPAMWMPFVPALHEPTLFSVLPSPLMSKLLAGLLRMVRSLMLLLFEETVSAAPLPILLASIRGNTLTPLIMVAAVSAMAGSDDVSVIVGLMPKLRANTIVSAIPAPQPLVMLPLPLTTQAPPTCDCSPALSERFSPPGPVPPLANKKASRSVRQQLDVVLSPVPFTVKVPP